jgi:Caspase domain
MDTTKRALLVGIDQYQFMPQLRGCTADAIAMRDLLQRNDNGSPNYDCRVLTSADGPPVTRELLRSQWHTLFDNFDGHVLFHFSGHGKPTSAGGVLVTQDGTPGDPGLPMDELLTLANRSKAKTLLLIVDSCYAGNAGDPAILQGNGSAQNQALIREGVTILAASRQTESARETGGHGVFTKLILGALQGGAADVRGRVSVASIYAYVEQALGSWEQRPMYKSYADYLPPVRLCRPSVPDTLLRALPKLFKEDTAQFCMCPSFERTHPSAKPSHVNVFDKFKALRNANLLTTQGGRDLYFIAMEAGWVKLTPLGRFYRQLAEKGLI